MPTPQPSARDAVAVLRQRFRGFDPTAADDPESTIVDDPGGALALHALREGRASELEDRLAADEAATLVPTEGYVQGEPGRRMRSNASAAMSAHVGRRRLQALGADMAADPDTGVAAQARVQGVQTALDDAATTARPELTDAANAVATRNAFGTYMKSKGMKMGEYEAAASPAAQAAAEVPLHAQASDVGERLASEKLARDQALRMSPQLVPGQVPVGGAAGGGAAGGGDTFNVGGFTVPPNYKPLGAEAEKSLRGIRSVAPLLGRLEQLIDPTRAEVPNALTSRAAWGLYHLGMSPENIPGVGPEEQQRMQIASLISIAGASPYMQGTRAYQYLKEVQQHLTNPVATDAFLAKQINELKQRWPSMYQEILNAHYNPGAPLDFGGDQSGADMSDPNRGMEGR